MVEVAEAPSYVTRRFIRDLNEATTQNGLHVRSHLVDYGRRQPHVNYVYDLCSECTVPLLQIGGLKFGRMRGKDVVAITHVVHEPIYVIDILNESKIPTIIAVAKELKEKGYDVRVEKS